MANIAASVWVRRSFTLIPRPIVSGGLRRSRNFSTTTVLREKRYTEAHEWIELSGDKKIGTIGVSTYAAKALGDVVYVELPSADLVVNAGDSMGAVESVKSASDIYAPISGKVVETNSILEEKPGTINQSPEDNGWIARIEIGEGEVKRVEDLMTTDDYKKFTED